jgi:HSP20 family protein
MYVLCRVYDCALAGVNKTDISVTINKGMLVISAKRERPVKENSKPQRQERLFGDMNRSLPLPKEADAEAVKASYVDGVLTVTIPKKTPAVPETTSVQIE